MLSESRVNNLSRICVNGQENVRSTRHSRNWKCKLPETLVGDFLIIPITSTKSLRSEAYWMSNCCGNYTRSCADDEYSLFSIRSRSGERLATLGLVNDNGSWRFDQCFGPSNSEVLEETLEYLDEDGIAHSEYWPTELYYVAHEVVRLMNSDCSSH